MAVTQVQRTIGAHTLSLQTGKWAKQASGAVVVQLGETLVLVTAVEGTARPGADFFPLQVEYRERTHAAGKFPGGYIKRETRPTTKETLTSRLIDRPLRPLFPADYFNEVQIMATVHSADKENDPDVLGMIGASAALHISSMPFTKVTGSVRVGRVDGQLVVFPTHSQMEKSDLDLVVSGTRDAVAMIEGFAREFTEDDMLKAIEFAHAQIIEIIELIEELRTKAGLGKKPKPPEPEANPLKKIFTTKHAKELTKRKLTKAKLERYAKVKEFKETLKETYLGEDSKYTESQFNQAWSFLEEKVFRDLILDGKRLDGRGFKEIRPLLCEAGVLPRTHGSALFQRGETQALVTATLGTVSDEQKVESLEGEYSKKFMLDYNFPPFSVGECKPIRGPGRREIGHGMLAERSLKAVLPAPEVFPYTIRLVSEILESNGSSSMASVCGGTLALMDAGVPIRRPVAGISIGLVKDGKKAHILTDIQGDEDHYGDMDFKVAGTGVGITGIQLDLKIEGIEIPLIKSILEQAKEGRKEILRTMLTTALGKPRKELKSTAPRLLTLKINPEKIGLLIGPGGKTIKAIQESTGAKIDIEDDGTVYIAHSDAAGAEMAKAKVEALVEEVQVGKVYTGKVTGIKEYGAFIEVVPGKDGLCHVSDLAHEYIARAEDVVNVGDIVQVKVLSIDEQNRIKLSRKALIPAPVGGAAPPAHANSGGGGSRDGGGREDRGGRGGRSSRRDKDRR
ncbi:MAG: polyribonucleotide nucleotidyltransferase [Gemmataceae bacterium]|nr:polyribonucleotide nucleotidyltransferase [Gemmataceae bacterium]